MLHVYEHDKLDFIVCVSSVASAVATLDFVQIILIKYVNQYIIDCIWMQY